MQTDLLTSLLFRQAAAVPSLSKASDADFELVFLADGAADDMAGLAPMGGQSQQRQTTDGSASDTDSPPDAAPTAAATEGDEQLDPADDGADFRRVVLTDLASDTTDSRAFSAQTAHPRMLADAVVPTSVPAAKPPMNQPVSMPAAAPEMPARPTPPRSHMAQAQMMQQADPRPGPVRRAEPDPRPDTPVAAQPTAVETPRPIVATPAPTPRPDTMAQMTSPTRSETSGSDAALVKTQPLSQKDRATIPVVPARAPQQTGPAERIPLPFQPGLADPKAPPAIAQKPTAARSEQNAASPAPAKASPDVAPEFVAKRLERSAIRADVTAKPVASPTTRDLTGDVRPGAQPLTQKPLSAEIPVATSPKRAMPERPIQTNRPDLVDPRQPVPAGMKPAVPARAENLASDVVTQTPVPPVARAKTGPGQTSEGQSSTLQQAPVSKQDASASMAPRVDTRPSQADPANLAEAQRPQATFRPTPQSQPSTPGPAAIRPAQAPQPDVVQTPTAGAQPIDRPGEQVAAKAVSQVPGLTSDNAPAGTAQPNRGTPPHPVVAQPTIPQAQVTGSPQTAQSDAPTTHSDPMIAVARPRDVVAPLSDPRGDRPKPEAVHMASTRMAEAAPPADPKPAPRLADPAIPAAQPAPSFAPADPQSRDQKTASAPGPSADDNMIDRTAPRQATPVPDPATEPQMPKITTPAAPLTTADSGLSSEPAELRLDPVRDTALTPTQAPAKSALPPQADLSARVMDQIAQHARQLPGGPVEITLSPEELGRVRMQLTTAENGLTLVVTADRPETLDLLRRNIDQLANEYRNLGYGSLSFAFQGDGTPRDGHPGHHQPGTATVTMADDITPDPGPTPQTAATGMDIRI